MVYPLLPAFLRSLGAGAATLGAMEGIAEGISALVKWQSGKLSDRPGRRKPLIVAGYALASIARPLIALTVAPWQIVALRTVDRIGKGIRGAPRDAILASAVSHTTRAAAFGFHRMMDNLGSVLGPIIAFVLLQVALLPLRWVFALALIPGLCSVATLVFGVADPDDAPPTAPLIAGASSAVAEGAIEPSLPSSARWYLLVVAVFTLGASADSFLLLHASRLGLADAWLPVLWLSLAAARAATNVPGGRLADRVGTRPVLIAGWVVYAIAYALFPMMKSVPTYWAMVLAYGTYYGLTEGSEKALLAELVPASQRGRAYGALHAVSGLAVLPANLGFGVLYNVDPALAFTTGAGFALVAAVGLAALRPPRNLLGSRRVHARRSIRRLDRHRLDPLPRSVSSRVQ
jgi:MFS family permease